MEEIWKDIRGYEGRYQVSNLGNVKSLNYGNHGTAKNLVPKVSNRGRPWVELAKDGAKKAYLVYRLVATEFIPNENNYPEVNHKDENVFNNCVDNLEWCTGEYNRSYSYNLHPEKHRDARESCTRTGKRYGKRTALEIEQLDFEGNVVKRWPNSRTIFNDTGMSDWSISECCRGKRKQAYGFKWRYAI